MDILEFVITRNINGKIVAGNYGVNVSNVREIVNMPKFNPLISKIDEIIGIFELRGIPILIVHLGLVLGDDKIDIKSMQQIIVTEFKSKRAGFAISKTNKIRRLNNDQILPPNADQSICINGLSLIENNEFLFILDLEKIIHNLENKSKKINCVQ